MEWKRRRVQGFPGKSDKTRVTTSCGVITERRCPAGKDGMRRRGGVSVRK